METRGTVHGRRVELEKPVPSLNGKRVWVRLELLEGERELSRVEQAELWQQWIESGPHGAIEDHNAADEARLGR